MLNSIPNIKLKYIDEIPQQEQESMRQLLLYLKPKDQIKGRKGKHIPELSFNEVTLLKQKLSQPDIDSIADIFVIVFGLKKRQLLNCRIVEFYHAYNYVVKQVEQIIKQEEKLSYKVNEKMKMAGVDRMNRFGVLNTLDALAMRYGSHPDLVKEWQYNYCFSLLFKMNIERRIQDDYNEIIKANAK